MTTAINPMCAPERPTWWHPRYNCIPQELRDKDIWLRWSNEERDGKITKIPYRADGRGMAKTNEPSTWSTFEAVAKNKIGSGLGCVVKDEFVVIDLDHVLDPETRTIETWAKEIVERCQSYTEISPSGAGLHIWVKGKLPVGRHRVGRMEMYDHTSPRYMTVSGNIYGECAEIRAVELTDIHRKMCEGADPQAKGEKAANGLKKHATPQELREELSKGNWQPYYDSQSQADLAYCRLIAPECDNDKARIDVAFRASGLMRPKWDERRGEQKYGEMTITKAMSGIVSVATFYAC